MKPSRTMAQPITIASGQADGAGGTLFLPRDDEAFGLHPRQRDVDRAALEAAFGSIDQLESEALAALEQVDDERLRTRD